MSVLTYDYSHVPTVKRFALSKARHRVIVGPFGSGKSVGCVMEIIRKGHEQTPSPITGIRKTRWAIIRNTFGQLRDTTMKTVFDWFPPDRYGVHRVADHEYIITEFDGVHIELFFRALDRPDQVANLLSLELTGAWINEAREVPREIWEGVDGRIGRYPSKRDGGTTWHGVIMDTNPPDEMNWLYKLVEVEKPANLELFKQPGGRASNAENLENLPKGYYTDLAIGKTDEYVRSYIDGEYGFVMSGDPVYKTSYNDGLHCAKSILEPLKGTPIMPIPLLSGWDFYLYPTLILGQYTNRGRLLIIDEVLGRNMGAQRFVSNLVDPVMNTAYRGMTLYGFGDPTGNVRAQSDESTCYQVLKENHYHWIKPANTNSEMARIGAVEHFLTKMVDGEPAFQISPKCQFLRKGFNGGYRRKDNGEIDKNQFSHCFAAGTMVDTEFGERPIETIKVGERVLTPFGFRKVLKSWKTRKDAEVIELSLSNGRKIVCTPDHKFIPYITHVHTKMNYVLANSLKYGTVLESISIQGVIRWNIKRLLNSMGLSSDFTETGITEAITRARRHGSIGRFGNSITGRFLKVIMSTTKMAIASTIPLGTLKSFPQLYTNPTMPGTTSSTNQIWHCEESRPPKRQQKNGTDLQREESGTGNTAKRHGSQQRKHPISVPIAGKNTLDMSGPGRKGFALCLARVWRERRLALMTLKDRALSAARFLKRINTVKPKHAVTVVGVRPLAELTDVYNITVENFHCYYTNQTLTFNCHDALQYLCLYALYKNKRPENTKATRAASRTHTPATSAGY